MPHKKISIDFNSAEMIVPVEKKKKKKVVVPKEPKVVVPKKVKVPPKGGVISLCDMVPPKGGVISLCDMVPPPPPPTPEPPKVVTKEELMESLKKIAYNRGELNKKREEISKSIKNLKKEENFLYENVDPIFFREDNNPHQEAPLTSN